MAMGRRKEPQTQQQFWIEVEALPKPPGNPFYEKVNKVLDKYDFDEFVEELCAKFYAEKMGRPSLAPGVYFRALMVGYFEGIDGERGIAWRLADSISLRTFLGLELTDSTVDHSTISRTRRLIDVETHEAIFDQVQLIIAKEGLLRGKTVGVDGTTLEANAAMRSIVRRDSGETYSAYVKRLAQEAGIEDPTQNDVAGFDRKRKKKTSNKDWEHPHDPDAKVAKMKDGRIHMAHKVEHAVDMETGAIVAVTVQSADQGDTSSVSETLEEVKGSLEELIDDPEAAENVSNDLLLEFVADKGYHSNAVLVEQKKGGIRTYISEPDRGRRNWEGKEEERVAVKANRGRIRGKRGRRLMRTRGEKIERSFAHCYNIGGMRRTHLRGHENIRKRLLIHVAAFNLSLILRRELGFGTPRGLRAFFLALFRLISELCQLLGGLLPSNRRLVACTPSFDFIDWAGMNCRAISPNWTSATGC
jgi:transposase